MPKLKRTPLTKKDIQARLSYVEEMIERSQDVLLKLSYRAEREELVHKLHHLEESS